MVYALFFLCFGDGDFDGFSLF